jgi:hypothetical protein
MNRRSEIDRVPTSEHWLGFSLPYYTSCFRLVSISQRFEKGKTQCRFHSPSPPLKGVVLSVLVGYKPWVMQARSGSRTAAGLGPPLWNGLMPDGGVVVCHHHRIFGGEREYVVAMMSSPKPRINNRGILLLLLYFVVANVIS